MENKIIVSAWRLPAGQHAFAVNGTINIVVGDDGVSVISHRHSVCRKVPHYSRRFTCTCDPAIEGDLKARYAQQVLLDLPDGKEKERRISEGLHPKVCIDPCIVPVIQELWSHGIETLGSCCGHNYWLPYVDVPTEHFDKMYALGFQKYPDNEHGQLSFLL